MLATLLSLSLVHAASGPHAVSFQDLAFDDTRHGQGTVYGRVYYPAQSATERADPLDGPYPLVAQLHGWLGSAWMYDEFCLELASWGFVVAATATETGVNLNMETFAWDTVALIDHIEDQSQHGGTFLEGLVDQGSLAAVGHSMGGATLGRLVEIEPRIAQLVALMPYEGERSYYENIAAFEGSALYIAGSEDETSLPPMVEDWFDRVASARRALHIEIEGAGHQAVTDFQWGQESMDDQEQLDAVEHLATRFLRAEILGQEALYHDVIGPGAAHIPATARSQSIEPALWAQLDDAGRVQVGVAGLAGSSLEVHLAEQGVPDGELLAPSTPVLTDASLSEGLWQGTVDVPSAWTQGLYVQGQLDPDDVRRATRVVELVAGADPTDTSTVDGDDERIGGCDVTSRPATIGWALLLLPLLRLRSDSGIADARGSATLRP